MFLCSAAVTPSNTALWTGVCDSRGVVDLYHSFAFHQDHKKFNTCENVPPQTAFTTMEEIRNSFKVGLVCLKLLFHH